MAKSVSPLDRRGDAHRQTRKIGVDLKQFNSDALTAHIRRKK